MQSGVVITDTPEGVFIKPRDQRVVLNTLPCIEFVRNQCLQYGEISAVDFGDAQEFDMFMNDIYNQCEYYTNVYTQEHLRVTIDRCLDNFQDHTGYAFTSMQRYLWTQVATEIVSQTFEYGLRDTHFICKYAYDSMVGFSMVLKLYNE